MGEGAFGSRVIYYTQTILNRILTTTYTSRTRLSLFTAVGYTVVDPGTSEWGGGKKHEIKGATLGCSLFYDYFLQARGGIAPWSLLNLPLTPSRGHTLPRHGYCYLLFVWKK